MENFQRSELLLPLAYDLKHETVPDNLESLEEQLSREEDMINHALAELSTRTGMPIVREKGVRRYGPPTGFNGIPPPRDSEIFVGGLPRNCYEVELIPILEKIGPIYQMRLMMNFSGNNKGYAFVQYLNKEDAERAIRELNNLEIREGWRIAVLQSMEKRCLFLCNIPKNKNYEEIRTEILCSTVGVVNINVPKPLSNSTYHQNKGYAFVEFENHKSAMNFMTRVRCTSLIFWNKPIKVKWAEPVCMSRAITVVNISPNTSATDLERNFNRVTNNGVIRVEQLVSCALIYFQTRHKAKMASKVMNNKIIDGYSIKVRMNTYFENGNLRHNALESTSSSNELMMNPSENAFNGSSIDGENIASVPSQEQDQLTRNDQADSE